MPLNKLDNFIKNTEGRILYVSPSDLDSTDSITNSGNSLARPFKTIQRALIESARFSFVIGGNNDQLEKTTILLMPGEHVVDNRPGFQIQKNGSNATYTSPENTTTNTDIDLSIESNFDLNQKNNTLYKFNSVHGGVIVPRGTSIVGLDLRKTKIRPTYVPNPTDPTKLSSAIFRLTGACYLWQFSIFDGNELGTVYVDGSNFGIKVKPTFSHHKLTVFEYADGVNPVTDESTLTDLDMYYAKLNRAYNSNSSRPIGEVNADKFPNKLSEFTKRRPEYEIVGAFASDPISISSIYSGNSSTDPNPSTIVTVTTTVDHNLDVGTPIKIRGISELEYNVSTKVVETNVDGDTRTFKYNIPSGFRNTLLANPTGATAGSGTVTVETDTVDGASPYIFNCSLRSVWGMNGLHADGNKATGFRSIVVAQFTGVSLQKDDRAFVKYISSTRGYSSPQYTDIVTGNLIAAQSSATESAKVYHLDPEAIYRKGWENTHIKASNDAILQIVSVFAIGYNNHFKIESGSDASITNSNSNFGQLSLVSEGFKKESFTKDNNAFVTHIIPPRSIIPTEEDIDWLRFDITSSTNTKLYIDGFKNESVKPPSLTQGFRVGARNNDVLYFDIDGVSYNKKIIMPTNSESSEKSYSASITSGSKLTLGEVNSTLEQGEKVIVLSDSGDLPENIDENSYYYVMKTNYIDTNSNSITFNNNQIQLASSKTDADNNVPVSIYGGTNLKIITRVCDKNSGELGHPIQYDSNGWYITVSSDGTDFTSLTGISEASLIKRIVDSRSLDEKIYKLRVVVPKELTNAKNPEAGFIIQESSSTGFLDNIILSELTRDDGSKLYNYKKNLSIITSCVADTSNQKAIVTVSHPHKLNVGDVVLIKNVKSSGNVSGEYEKQYNGRKVITDIGDGSGDNKDKVFQYTYTGSDTFTISEEINENMPRFERNDCNNNLYIYRNEVIQDYVSGQRDGIYHIYVLSSDIESSASEFSTFKYSQNVVDLYPQLDRDNTDENPKASKSFGVRSPLGKVVSNDLKKSVTRESLDKTLTSIGGALKINQVTSGGTEDTITFERDHGLNSLIKVNISTTGNSNYKPGRYYGVKLLDSTGTTWKGATADILVSGTGKITEATIVDGGSNYTTSDSYLSPIGTVPFQSSGTNVNAQLEFTASDIKSDIGKVIQFDGVGTSDNTHRIIKEIVSSTQIKVHKYTNDSAINSGHYGIIVGSAVAFTATPYFSGISTVTTTDPHGLSEGNKFQVVDTINRGSFLVDSIDGTSFEVKSDIGTTSGQLMKLGISANEGTSDKSDENLASRAITFFDNSDGKITIDESVTPNVGTLSNITKEELPLGSYIQVNEEIMRVGGFDGNNIKLIRAVFGTRKKTHASNSLVRKINPLAIELRRPSIIRASGHTFEYLGYGPGNYSTGLPQIQTRTLTEREEFLSQSQERSSGIVVYTGMNNKGDFFIGNQKKSSATGEEVTFDTPVPTITGQDPSRLSGIFDEITIKERIVIEGGDSKQILSQFDGPVTFNKEVRIKDSATISGNFKVINEDDSDTYTTGSITTKGGIGVAKKLRVQGKTILTGLADIQNITSIGGTFGNIQISTTDDQTIDTNSGNLKLGALLGSKVAIQTNTNIDGELTVSGDITAFYSSDERLKDNITPIDDPLAKVISISGNTFDWNDKSKKRGNDTGLIAQEVEALGLPGLVVTRDNGYLAVDYHKVVPLLVEAIKELSEKVDSLEQKLQDK